MIYPSLDEVKKYSESYNLIPVCMEVHADLETPISVFMRFADEKYALLLESVEKGEKWGRFSFIGRNPFMTFRSSKNTVTIEDGNRKITTIVRNPLDELRSLISSYKSPNMPGIPGFNGGVAGYFGYDMVRHVEKLPNVPKDDMDIPECNLMFFDELIAFDHLKQKILLIVNMHTGDKSLPLSSIDIERNYNSAVDRLKALCREVLSTAWKANAKVMNKSGRPNTKHVLTANITKEQFCENVRKAKQYIKDGDIFQVVLSQRIDAKTDQDPFDVYRALRCINPSPYMYYLKFDGYCIVGSSPEMLAKVEDNIVETCPIAGTRRRGKTEEEDVALQKELLSDSKEIAEHTMLVDLGRNDIGKVSEIGSVEVKDFMHIEKFSHVMHIVTNVRGRLAGGKTAFDALLSVLPAGTLSGAPKVRAMEIIDELETTKRNAYGGCIAYLGFNGNMDSCITIRTLVFKNGTAYIQAGAGIVADSDPENEYYETLNKAEAMIKALDEADGIYLKLG